jgi:hypothetical protein
MGISTVSAVLWFTPIVIQSIIAVVMLRRKLVDVFPIFFVYSVLIPSRDILLYFVQNRQIMYSRIYFVGEAVAVVLSLGVIYEVIRHLVRPYSFLRRFAFRTLQVVALVGVVAGLVMLVSSSPPAHRDPELEIIILVARSARFLQACWLILLILLITRLGLTWHNCAIGIATGFGIYSAMSLALLDLRAQFQLIGDGTMALWNSVAYNVAVLVWALYFVPSRPKEAIVKRLPSTEIARWNEVLSEYLKR